MPSHLTDQQYHKLEILERVASGFSVVGTSFIFFTFLYSPAFRKPINRLVFYASWGNLLCNIATLMAQSGIRAGQNSHLCQFQAFLIQMFLLADALWNLAMAINVYLTIFRKFNANKLKQQEWKYFIMSYGLPFVVAFACLFVETPSRGKLYGPAVQWCSIDINWVEFRIALVYAPAWLCIIIAFTIYVLAGREIFAKRKQLRAFAPHNLHPNPTSSTMIPPSRSTTPSPEPPRTTSPSPQPSINITPARITVTSELATIISSNPSSETLIPEPEKTLPSTSITTKDTQNPSPHLTIKEVHGRDRSPSPQRYRQYSVSCGSTLSPSPTPGQQRTGSRPSFHRGASSTGSQGRGSRAAVEANTAALAYTKVALLFFVSLLVTWLPSSVNRILSLVHPEQVSVPLSFAAGVVIPLMGFWNSVIYVTTSWNAVRRLFGGELSVAKERERRRRSVRELGGGGYGAKFDV